MQFFRFRGICGWSPARVGTLTHALQRPPHDPDHTNLPPLHSTQPAPRPRLCLTWASSDPSLRLPTNDSPAYHSAPFIPHTSRHIHRQHTARPLCCQHYDAKETWRRGSFAAATLRLGDTQARFEMAVGTLAWAEGASWTEAGGCIPDTGALCDQYCIVAVLLVYVVGDKWD